MNAQGPRSGPLRRELRRHSSGGCGLTPLKRHQLLARMDVPSTLRMNIGEDQFTCGIRRRGPAHHALRAQPRGQREKIPSTCARRRSEGEGLEELVNRPEARRSLHRVEESASEWMILESSPSSRPSCRPLVPLDCCRFATSDLNDLYRRVNQPQHLPKRLDRVARAP